MRGVRWAVLLLMACGPMGVPEPFVAFPVRQDHSLFWNDPALLDDPSVISFSKLMAAASNDGHGGALLQQWFHRFATADHGGRAYPAQFVDDFATAHGSDPTRWDLSQMSFKVTGIHNRIDRAQYSIDGNCGELRASVASTELTLQPFHVLFIFHQPLGPGDVTARGVTCEGTARRWAALSMLEGEALREAVREQIREGFVHERFALIETVEQTISPWEWRQWIPVEGGLDNPPLFQQADIEGLNPPGPRHDEFIAWVADNAAAIDARALLIPEKFRAPSVRVTQGPPRETISFTGLRAGVAAAHPDLRKNFELMGCAACHTTDADFVQTSTQRVVSKFYEKELLARERHLELIAWGKKPFAPFGPLQQNPLLPQ
jgi:hypothetical protein